MHPQIVPSGSFTLSQSLRAVCSPVIQNTFLTLNKARQSWLCSPHPIKPRRTKPCLFCVLVLKCMNGEVIFMWRLFFRTTPTSYLQLMPRLPKLETFHLLLRIKMHCKISTAVIKLIFINTGHTCIEPYRVCGRSPQCTWMHWDVYHSICQCRPRVTEVCIAEKLVSWVKVWRETAPS